MSRQADLSSLEALLDHRFRSRELLTLALTHRSLGHERSAENDGSLPLRRDNERLEFLGDAVLGLVISQALYALNPDWQEGELTRVKAELVSRKHMAQVALSLDLGRFLLLGKGEERTGGRRKLTLLANAMEAVLAALYLDGGLEVVRRVAERYILAEAARQLAARIEVEPEEVARLARAAAEGRLLGDLRALGFAEVTIDPRGYGAARTALARS